MVRRSGTGRSSRCVLAAPGGKPTSGTCSSDLEGQAVQPRKFETPLAAKLSTVWKTNMKPEGRHVQQDSSLQGATC